MRLGRRLAIDVGKARIGLAISDQSALLASPLATVQRLESLAESAQAVLAQCADFDIIEIYVGVPLKLSGEWSPSTFDAVEFAECLQSQTQIPVRFIDERMTTKTAATNLRSHGFNAKNSRGIVDQEAAAIILESALNQERLNGQTPGKSASELERP